MQSCPSITYCFLYQVERAQFGNLKLNINVTLISEDMGRNRRYVLIGSTCNTLLTVSFPVGVIGSTGLELFHVRSHFWCTCENASLTLQLLNFMVHMMTIGIILRYLERKISENCTQPLITNKILGYFLKSLGWRLILYLNLQKFEEHHLVLHIGKLNGIFIWLNFKLLDGAQWILLFKGASLDVHYAKVQWFGAPFDWCRETLKFVAFLAIGYANYKIQFTI